MLDLSGVTAISVNRLDPIQSCKAIEYSAKKIIFNSCIVLSPFDFEYPGIQTVNVGNLLGSFSDFNKFHVFHLHKYFDTSHCLMIHPDGFVVNPDKWEHSFLEYDYIGAPWPDGYYRVGNGGFSLRSKRLCELIPKVIPMDAFNEDPLLTPEDRVICSDYRKTLVNLGIVFPSIEVAARFSVESILNDISSTKDPKSSFGFHGKNFPHNKIHLKLID